MPKIIDHDARRAEILEGSFDLFARLGRNGVTMRKIAKELGFSTGTLYHYFDDKETLYREMFRHMSRKDVQRALEAIDETWTVEMRVRFLFDFLRANESYFQNVIIMAMDDARRKDEEHQQHLREIVMHYRKAISDQLGLAGTGLDSLLFSFILGMLVQRLFGMDADMEEHHAIIEQVAGVLGTDPGEQP